MSRPLSKERFAQAVGGHWGVENALHWQLDVTFREGQCRAGKDHGPAGLSSLRRTGLSLIKNETTCKVGISTERQRLAVAMPSAKTSSTLLPRVEAVVLFSYTSCNGVGIVKVELSLPSSRNANSRR